MTALLVDILRWWLAIQLIGLLALPITAWFFGRMPDRGYGFAKPLGLLLTGYDAWLLSMLGLAPFGGVSLGGVALLICAGGCVLLGRPGLAQLRDELRGRAGWLGFQEFLFAGALYVGIWLRWHDFFGNGVALWHTEQPMDLTFISGILASPQFPPQDPWLASYPINYYYFGYLLIAALIRLSGVTIGVGYTLGIATVFALTATSVAGLVGNLIGTTDHRPPTTDHRRQTIDDGPWPTVHGHPPRNPKSKIQNLKSTWLFPLLGAALVLLAGNQAGALQVIAGSEKVVALEPPQLATAIGNGLGARQPIDLPPTFPAAEFDGEGRLVPSDKLADFNAWWPSRTVWDELQGPDGQVQRVYAITEFPVFSFLLGDLHPHVLSLPWSLLAMAFGLNLLLRPNAPDVRTRGGVVRLLMTGIVLGGLYAINSWDLPTYLLLYLGALGLLYLRLAPTPRHFFWAHFAQQAGAVLLASYVVYLPFHLSFTAPTQGFPLALSPAHTGLVEFVVIFGLFFVPLSAYTLQLTRAFVRHTHNVALLILFASAGLIGLGVLVGWPLFGLFPAAIGICLLAYHYRTAPATCFALWVFALGALVVWGVDVIYLRDNYGSPRMNTIFKFYYQVWLLWGTLAAYALWVLTRRLRWTSMLWGAPFALLLVGSLVYPLLAPADAPPERTLDGLAYLAAERPAEAAAIDWIKQNLSGDALILQAPGLPYRSDTARIASATGRPALLGWTQHERLWRGGQPEALERIDQRLQAITTIYTTTDPQQAQALLKQYGVDYVYVGPNEQALAAEHGAPPDALTKFDGWMQRVFERDGIVIYKR